jgi:uncharacterized protein GlcG (DUF336 family)
MSSFVLKKTISLQVAQEIASQTIQTAQRNSFQPIAVCVMDSMGIPLCQVRMDACKPAFADMALHKAYTCTQVGVSTRTYGDKYLKAPSQPHQFMRLASQIASQQGRFISFPGGVVLKVSSGEVVGAVGVSGAAGDEDEYCALQGVHLSSIAKEVETEPRDHSCKTVKTE